MKCGTVFGKKKKNSEHFGRNLVNTKLNFKKLEEN